MRSSLYWLSETNNPKDIQVFIMVKKDILNKVIVKNETNLVRHFYSIILDIREINPISKEYLKKTRVTYF